VDIPYTGDVKSISGDDLVEPICQLLSTIGDDAASVDTGFLSDFSRSTARFMTNFFRSGTDLILLLRLVVVVLVGETSLKKSKALSF